LRPELLRASRVRFRRRCVEVRGRVPGARAGAGRGKPSAAGRCPRRARSSAGGSWRGAPALCPSRRSRRSLRSLARCWQGAAPDVGRNADKTSGPEAARLASW